MLFVLLCALLIALPMGAQGEGIDFANGNIDFLALYTTPVDASPDTAMELVEYGEGMAVKITSAGDAAPYVVIDASSLLGDKVADLLTMQVMIATEHPSGDFYAVSGEILVFSGPDREETKSPWSVFLATKNPNPAKVTLDTDAKRFVPGAHNFFILNKKVDNGFSSTKEPTLMYLLSIEFLDGDGNALPVDADAVFNPPEGFDEQGGPTALYTLAGEAVIEGATGSTPGGWGQAVSLETTRSDGTIEPGWFTPGTVISVAYDGESAPEVIWQSWTDGNPNGWAKVAPRIVEGGVAQFFYDDIVASFGTDDFEAFFDKFNVGDTGEALTVIKVSYGQGYPPPFAVADEVVIEGAAGSSAGGWGQAVTMDAAKNDGPLDAALFAPGTVVTVAYDGVSLPEVIFQSWTDGAPDGSGWAKVAPSALGNGIAQFSYEDIVAAFGTDELEAFVDKFYVGDTGDALTVIKVTVGVPLPPLAVVNDEFTIEGAAGSSPGGWGQAVTLDTVKNDGIVDAAWFTPGTVITVLYEGTGAPEVIFQSWTDGNPNGWAKVTPFTAGAGIAQYSYNDIVASFGTDDFETFFDKFYVGDTGDALTVFKVTVGQAVGALPSAPEAGDEEEEAEEAEAIVLPPAVEVTDAFEIEGATGSTSGGWGQAVSMDTAKNGGSVDAAWFTPGTVITVEYESEKAPEIIWQSWTDGNPVAWAKVAPFAGEEGVAQFYYDHIVEAFGTDDFEAFFDKFNVGDTGEALTVTKVTVGMATAPVETAPVVAADDEEEAEEEEAIVLLPLVDIADVFEIVGAVGASGGGWGQAVSMDTMKNDGPVDPAWFTPGSVVVVLYVSDSVPEVIFQSWTDGNPNGWAKVAPFAGAPGVVQFAYDDIVASFGTDDLETYFDKFNVGDTGEALTVLKVLVGQYVPPPPPEFVTVADEFVIEGAEGTTDGGWGQAVAMDAAKNDGPIDGAWFAPGTVVTVTYESDSVPELVFQSWTDGHVVGWAKVAAFVAGDGVAQFSYDDIVASFGTDDLETLLDKFYVGDTGEALVVIKVTMGTAQ